MSRSVLFVYGTLRKGSSNHERLEGARFAGACSTASEYDITHSAGYPALVPGSRAVAGELYDVDETLLSRLDAFEGDDYRRATVRLADGELAIAYVLAAGGC
jgi:gamma-glutamylcyclotransferase (GGCT)/AIG2-like uncharacterized protein YtfP